MPRRSKPTGEKGLDTEIDALWSAIDALKNTSSGHTEANTVEIRSVVGNLRVENVDRDFFAQIRGIVVEDNNGMTLTETGEEAILTPLPTIVRKNSTGSDYNRRRLNLIEGTNVTLTVADDSGNNEVDVTIAASGTGFYWVDGWYYDNVSGTLSDYCKRWTGDGDRADYLTDGWIAGESGTITKIQVKSNAARTAGTLNVEIVKNGSATGSKATLDGTNTTLHTATVSVSVAAGDEITLTMDTSGWTPTTADIRAQFKVT